MAICRKPGCGEEIGGRHRLCPVHKAEAIKRSKDKHQKTRRAKDNRERSTPCVCPRCRANHNLKLFWTGSLPARKFCDPCRGSVDNSGQDFHRINLQVGPGGRRSA